MAEIDHYLDKIKEAIYGEEVRDSIHDAIEAIDEEVTTWTGLQDGSVNEPKLGDGTISALSRLGEVQAYARELGYIGQSIIFEPGGINSGVNVDTNQKKKTRVRTPGYLNTSDYSMIVVNRRTHTWVTYVSYFDSEYTFIRSSGAVHSSTITIDKTSPYFRIMAADTTGNVTTYPVRAACDYLLCNRSESSQNLENSYKAIKAFAYLGTNHLFDYSRSGNTTTLDFDAGGLGTPGNINIRIGTSAAVNIQFLDIAQQVSQLDTPWTAMGTTITVPSHSCGIYYDVDNNEMVYRTGYSHPSNSRLICLFESQYDSAAWGLLVDYKVICYAQGNELKNFTKATKVVAYLGKGKDFKYNRVGTSSYIIDMGGASIVFRVGTSDKITEEFSKFLNAALNTMKKTDPSSPNWERYPDPTGEEPATGVRCLNGNGCAIYYDISTNEFIFSDSGYMHDLSPNRVCLFETAYESFASGLLVDYQNNKDTNGIEKTIQKYVDSGSALPDYYTEYLKERVDTIRTAMSVNAQNSETFIFITDIHWETNTKFSPNIIRYLAKTLNINTIICGGDLINQGLKDKMIDYMVGCVSSFKNIYDIPFPIAFGNHDNNWNSYGGQRTAQPVRKFSPGEVYVMMQKQAENDITYISDKSKGFDFYYDRPSTKTRFIFLDTYNKVDRNDGTSDDEHGAFGFSNYTGLVNCLLGTPSGWHVVVVAHALYLKLSSNPDTYGLASFAENIGYVVDAYNSRGSVTLTVYGQSTTYNMQTAQAKVALMLAGHKHADIYGLSTAGNVPIVIRDCDSNERSDNKANRPDGTIYEQCIDVFVINYTETQNSAGSIDVYRIGYGPDHMFNFLGPVSS